MWHWLTWRNSRVRSLTRAVRLVLSIFQLPSISRPTSVLGPRPFGLPSFPGLPAIFTSVTGSSNLFSALPPPPSLLLPLLSTSFVELSSSYPPRTKGRKLLGMKLSILAFLSTPTPASLLFAHPPLPLFSHTPFLYFVLPRHPTPPSIRVPAQPPLTPHPLNSLHVALFLRSYVSLPFVSDSINLSAYLLSICWFLHSCVPLILCISTQVSIPYPSPPPSGPISLSHPTLLHRRHKYLFSPLPPVKVLGTELHSEHIIEE